MQQFQPLMLSGKTEQASALLDERIKARRSSVPPRAKPFAVAAWLQPIRN